MLVADNLVVIRNNHKITQAINFTVTNGQAIILRGRNGSGKSSVLRLLAGLLSQTIGNVLWNKIPINNQREEYSSNLYYISHHDMIKPNLTVYDHMNFWAGMIMVTGQEMSINHAIDFVGLTKWSNLPAGILSAGQKRRLTLARLSLTNRPLWLLDEPATSLDSAGILILNNLISTHLTQGGMIVMASHDIITIKNAQIINLTND